MPSWKKKINGNKCIFCSLFCIWYHIKVEVEWHKSSSSETFIPGFFFVTFVSTGSSSSLLSDPEKLSVPLGFLTCELLPVSSRLKAVMQHVAQRLLGFAHAVWIEAEAFFNIRTCISSCACFFLFDIKQFIFIT